MRIVLLTTSFPLRDEDTSGVFLRRLAEAMEKLFEVSVVTPAGPERPGEQSYRLCAVRYAPRKWQCLAHSDGGIADAIRRRDPKLAFLIVLVPALFVRTWLEARRANLVHGNWSIPSVIGAAAAICAGRPAVATLRGDDVTRAKSSWLFRAFLNLAVRLNDRVFCVSEAMTEDVQSLYPGHSAKIHFVPNGVTSEVIRSPGEFHFPIRLVTVGSCIARKRQDLIIKAMSEPGLSNQFSLEVIGDGPLRQELMELAANLGLKHQVHFVGSLPPDRVAHELAKADIFVLSSESEGRPNALLEAMACGLPAVASDIDGVRELLSEGCGQIFEPGSCSDLARVLGQLAANEKEAGRQGASARLKLRNLGLTWENSAACYLAHYESLL